LVSPPSPPAKGAQEARRRSEAGERFQREEKKGFVAENKENGEQVSERVKSNSVFKGSSSDETQTDHMRQLMEQLSVLLIKNSEQKTSGISINHIIS
jgi:hypothetical protein